ncbi:MAG TPA: formylmethanofuran dehydrogenase subunit C [Gemmatimonadales bacterium]
MSGGLTARLKDSLTGPADFGEVLASSWVGASARELSERPVYLAQEGKVRLGDLFEVQGTPAGLLHFEGELGSATRLGANLAEGQVSVDGNVGAEAGLGMSGGALVIEGNAGARAGAGFPGVRRGMTGGELIIRGSAGAEAGATMRRGVVAVGRSAGERAGLGMIAGTVVVLGAAGADSGLWSKRGSVVALGRFDPPPTYAYACTYQPIHLRLLLTRLKERYRLAVQRRHITGLYRRYSGDMAELSRGEILIWSRS